MSGRPRLRHGGARRTPEPAARDAAALCRARSIPAFRSQRRQCSRGSALAGQSGQPAPAFGLGERPDRRSVIAALRDGRNDLQASAIKIAPAIAETLEALERTAGARLARMSGSGATCFALYEDRRAAAVAAAALRRAYPSWWVRATVLR